MKSTHCRACGASDLHTLVDFGPQPLAGHFPTMPESVQPSRRYPLDLTECGHCGLLQVTHLPPIEEVFHADYRYSSSAIPALVRHFESYAAWLSERLEPRSRVLEFGCNDGVLLSRLAARGFQCLGIDASENVTQLARERGLTVTTGFFTPRFVDENQLECRFDLITCSNVFAHIDEVRECGRAAWMALRPGGLFCVEVHNADSIFDENQFDTVYHEHLSYYTAQTLARLLERSGFSVVETVRTTMHGDGLRMLVKRKETQVELDTAAPASSLVYVESRRLQVAQAMVAAAAAVRQLRDEYGPLVGYGAAGRSQMFVNFTGTADCFNRVFDDSPLRQGRFIAGTDVPIAAYANESGRCCLILAWNYAADISERLRGRFDRIATVLPRLRFW